MKKRMSLLFLTVIACICLCCFSCTSITPDSDNVTADQSQGSYSDEEQSQAPTNPDKIETNNFRFIYNETYGGYTLTYYKNKTNKHVEIPSEVEGFPVVAIMSAFSHCEQVESIIIPETVKHIDYLSFCHCDSLTSINIPKSVELISWGAFSSPNLSEITVDEENQHYKSVDGVLYTKDGTSLVEYPKGRTAEEYEVLSGVINIGRRAFSGNKFIKRVNLPQGLKEINWEVFSHCTEITEINLPKGLESVGYRAFAYCDNLKKVNIYSPAPEIADEVFYQSPSIEYTERNGARYLGNDQNDHLLLLEAADEVLAKTEIEDGCEVVYSNAFAVCVRLEELTVPKSVKYFGQNAFYHCTGLKRIYYKGSVEDWCNIHFDDSIIYSYIEGPDRASMSNPLSCGGDLYIDNQLISELVIPEGVTKINGAAFMGCGSITSVKMLGNVKEIGDLAFAYCNNLTQIDMADSIETIGMWAFLGDENIKVLNLPDGLIHIKEQAFTGLTSITELIIPNSVEKIDGHAFSYCSGLLKVVVGAGVKEVGYRAFFYCTSIVEAISRSKDFVITQEYDKGGCLGYYADFIYNLGDEYESSEIQTNDGFVTYTSEGETVLVGYTGNLSMVTIPDEVTKIREYAFSFAEGVEEVIFGKGVKEICDFAFERNTAIKSVKMNDQVVTMGSRAFYGCRSLESVELSEGLKSIGKRAFDDCVSLENISIPKGVVLIGEQAFSSTGIKQLSFEGEGIVIEEYAFAGCSGLKSLNLEGVEKIGGHAFERCKSITELTVADSVTYIGAYAFSYCYGLEKLTYGNGVDKGGRYAFKGCTNLKEVDFGNLTYLSEHMFEGCTALTEVDISENIVVIADHAFDGCEGLTKVVMGNCLFNMGYMAFTDCSSLNQIIYKGTLNEWAKILKGDLWYRNVPADRVECSDGYVTIFK